MEAEQLVDAGLDRRTGLPELASIVQVGGLLLPLLLYTDTLHASSPRSPRLDFPLVGSPCVTCMACCMSTATCETVSRGLQALVQVLRKKLTC